MFHLPISNPRAQDRLAKASFADNLVHVIPIHPSTPAFAVPAIVAPGEFHQRDQYNGQYSAVTVPLSGRIPTPFARRGFSCVQRKSFPRRFSLTAYDRQQAATACKTEPVQSSGPGAPPSRTYANNGLNLSTGPHPPREYSESSGIS